MFLNEDRLFIKLEHNMKNIRLRLSALAVLTAGTGILVNAIGNFAPVYYRAADAKFNTPGANCDMVVTLPCEEAAGTQCVALYYTQLPGETSPSPKIYYISKRVDGGACLTVTRSA